MSILKGIIISVMILIFLLLFFWIYYPKNKSKFDNYSNIPFTIDDSNANNVCVIPGDKCE